MVSFQPRLLVSEAELAPPDGIMAESASYPTSQNRDVGHPAPGSGRSVRAIVSLAVRLAGSVAVWVRMRRPQLRELPHSSKRSLSGPPTT